MPILNYTTEVEASRTVGEIQSILGSKGCRQITVSYDAEGKAEAVSFVIAIGGQDFHFKLPRNVEGVQKALTDQKGVENKYRTYEAAERISWRIIKDWIAAQMALVEASQVKMAEAFLPYMMDQAGQTMFQRFEKSLPQLQESNENPKSNA